MSSVATRLYVVIGIILAASGIGYWVQAAAEPPSVEMPSWSIKDLPQKLGNWRGEDTELDPTIAAATGASTIANRIYSDDQGRTISLHTAMFKDPSEGVYHSPMNCYRSNGWTKKSETQEMMKVSDDLTIPIKVIAWEKENEKILVAYWYQLGENVLFDRFELGTSVRWKMRGESQWPVLIKVMLQAPMVDPDETKTIILGFGTLVSEWLNSPEHRQYLNRWGGA